MQMRINVDLDAAEIVSSVNYDEKQLLRFIMELDSEMSDYEFTEKLLRKLIEALILEHDVDSGDTERLKASILNLF